MVWMDLREFHRDGGAPIRSVRIDQPSTIFQFPVVSNLMFHRGRYLLAWAERTKDERARVMILEWDPEKGTEQRTVLRNLFDTNTHMSLAAIDRHVMVAWHGYYAMSRDSIIHTAIHTLEE
jgi:hypothetical protein